MRVRNQGRVYEGPEPSGQSGRDLMRRWGPILGRAGIPGLVQGGRVVDACYVLMGLDRYDELSRELLSEWTRDEEAIDLDDMSLDESAELTISVMGKSGFFGHRFRDLMVAVEASQLESTSGSPSPALSTP